MEYLDSKRYNSEYKEDMIGYLDRYVTKPIREPADIIKIFARIEKGRKHLWLGLRAVFNYLEALGYHVDHLRKAMPRSSSVQNGIDLRIPSEAEIVNSLHKIESEKYHILYRVLIDSGLRLVEAVDLTNGFNPQDAQPVNGSAFYRIAIEQFRGSKQAYYGYLTEKTFQELVRLQGRDLKRRNASHYYDKIGCLSPKYLRKFAFDKMIELGVPESVADFIEGRVATRIGAKHYMSLVRQADMFYGKYAEYIASIRGMKRS